MSSAITQQITIGIDGTRSVSGLLLAPGDASACCVLAHGAGAGMSHSFLEDIAALLAARRVATLRFQFPYMELKLKRPDTPNVAKATVRAAVTEAARLLPRLPLFAGGKSFGGRMTSQALAELPLPRVRGLIFLGFPLHPAGKPSDARGQHLFEVRIPMLFLQGTRDALAGTDLLQPFVARLGALAQLKLFPGADHSFHVPAKLGRTDSEVRAEIADIVAAWIREVIGRARPDFKTK